MQHYNPGPDGSASDNYNEDPRGADAPKRRLGEDAKQLNSQDER